LGVWRGSTAHHRKVIDCVDEGAVAAKLEDGVLTLTLPKREGSRNRRIAIQ
jgi:HSP20 family molecular chaperone IbpA